MSLSQTDLANNALAGIGSKVIQDLNDDSNVTARKLKTVYEASLRGIARLHNWNSLVKLTELGPDPENVPPFGYVNAFRLPGDFIKLVMVNGVEIGSNPGKYALRGRHIHSDDDTAQIEYIAYVDDPTIYDALFAEAFIVYLSSKIAIEIRQDEALAAEKMNEFKAKLDDARKTDGNERRKTPWNPSSDSSWVKARRISTLG